MRWRISRNVLIVAVFLSAFYTIAVTFNFTNSLSESAEKSMYQNLLSESAGIAVSAILALTVYYSIEKFNELASHDRLRRLSQKYIADLVHNFMITSSLNFPIKEPGEIIAQLVNQTMGTVDVIDEMDSLIKQIEALPYTLENGKDLSDLSRLCYRQEKVSLEQIGGLIGQYARYMRTWPELVTAIFQFNITKAKLDRTIALQESEDIPDYLKRKADVYLTFVELLKDVRTLYGIVV